MNSDAYYEIGASHTVCEDYALSGEKDDLCYAIVSDGCSSSKDTDLGARLLAHIAKDALLYLHSRKLFYHNTFLEERFREVFEEIILKKCMEVKDTLKLTSNVFDATLLVAIGVGKTCILFGQGDGYFIIKKTNSEDMIVGLNYPSNAPYYLSYEMSFERKQAYEQTYGNQNVILTDKRVKDMIPIDSLDSAIDFPPVEGSIFRLFTPGIFDEEDVPPDVSQVILCSDGIDTYEDNPKTALPEGKEEREEYEGIGIMQEMVNYKNPVGSFVQRRMIRMKKDMEKRGIVHQDDMSCAVINF